MVVIKFGGSSLASSDHIERIADIISDLYDKEDMIMVVSAMGKTTDKLLQLGQYATVGKSEHQVLLKELEDFHVNVCKKLFSHAAQSGILTSIKLLFNKLRDAIKGISLIEDFSPKSKDLVLSHGEKLSSTIISEFLKIRFPETTLIDPTSLIQTDTSFGNAKVDFIETQKKVSQQLSSFHGIGVCPGFIGASKTGELTTLGRGGSDFTASILASALKSKSLDIWTDVTGMMTADPRLVPSAHSIPRLSYEEAMELSHFGAKVIYPPTIQPALRAQIPIKVKNTFDHQADGTLITKRSHDPQGLVKGISSIQDVALFNLKGAGMVGIPNFSKRLFHALSNKSVNVILISQASSEHSICVCVTHTELEESLEALNTEFEAEMALGTIDALEVERNLSILAVVGAGMKHQAGVSGKLFGALGANGVNIVAIAQGSSERNISIVIKTHDLKKALNSLHERFFLSEISRTHLFIVGVGNVGATFLEQLRSQQETLIQDYHADVKVVGIANSRKMILDSDGIDLAHWRDSLDGGKPMDSSGFIQRMQSMNLRNSVFIDNTASSDIPEFYGKILSMSISVVTPNKIACSSGQDIYNALKAATKRHNVDFLYETNVGAGLPVISTLKDLIKSGDRILGIEAVLSGSLNFIFNHYQGESTFAEIVQRAMDEGYTEPDPRIDLSGSDVMRKILILVREAGISMELEDVQNEQFLPDSCRHTKDVDSFLRSLREEEHEFKLLLQEAIEKKAKLKFVAGYDGKVATTGLRFIDEKHPFFHLEGKDNIVLFRTSRYTDQPLVIKGAGAGAEVTASGIFADVIRIANVN